MLNYAHDVKTIIIFIVTLKLNKIKHYIIDNLTIELNTLSDISVADAKQSRHLRSANDTPTLNPPIW